MPEYVTVFFCMVVVLSKLKIQKSLFSSQPVVQTFFNLKCYQGVILQIENR